VVVQKASMLKHARNGVMQEAGMMAAMRHPNVVLYLGVCLDPPCVVTEYCARGSLNDVLKRALYNAKCAPSPPCSLSWETCKTHILGSPRVHTCLLAAASRHLEAVAHWRR
jgi:serine/threonine protein kinase